MTPEKEDGDVWPFSCLPLARLYHYPLTVVIDVRKAQSLPGSQYRRQLRSLEGDRGKKKSAFLISSNQQSLNIQSNHHRD